MKKNFKEELRERVKLRLKKNFGAPKSFGIAKPHILVHPKRAVMRVTSGLA